MSAFMCNEDTLDLLASVTSWRRDDLWVYVGEDTLPPRGEITFERGGNYYGSFYASLIKEELRRRKSGELCG
jgi:hypothetical protein